MEQVLEESTVIHDVCNSTQTAFTAPPSRTYKPLFRTPVKQQDRYAKLAAN